MTINHLTRALHDLTICVLEEIHDGNDERMTEGAAQATAAALLVGMRNRGWLMEKMLRTHEDVTYGDEQAATHDQVMAFLDKHANG